MASPIERERPRDVWMAPECGPWGSVSRLNLCRSSTTRQKILEAREREREHLKLCDEVFNFQPVGSVAFDQPEMDDVSEVGKL